MAGVTSPSDFHLTDALETESTSGANEEFDAFNDDTFGTGAEAWEESAHEQLATLTEEERKALESSNAFFDFGAGGDGELGGLDDDGLLEPLEDEGEETSDLPEGNGHAAASSRGGMPPLAHELEARLRLEDDPAIVNAVPPQMRQQQQFPQHQPQQGQFPPPPNMMMGGAVPPPQQQMMQHPQPPAGPAIMTVGKIPPHLAASMMNDPRAQQHFQQQQFLLHQQQQQQQQQAQMQLQQQQRSQQMRAAKTLEELEREMLSAPHPDQQRQQQQQQQQNQFNQLQQQHNQQQFNPMHRGYPQQNFHRGPPPPMHMSPQGQHPKYSHQQHQGYQQQQHGYQNQQQHRRQYDGGYRDNRYHMNNNYHHMNHRGNNYGGGGGGGGGGGYNRSRNPNDDKNSETFGADFVHENVGNGGDGRSQYNYNNPARRDLMPGQVHVAGILRQRSSRGEEAVMGTGNPSLDLEMEKKLETAMSLQEADYQQRSSDEYAGMMSARERQWIVNIQLNQLKCENPFVDDYYYTVYNQKKMSEAEAMEKAREKAKAEEEENLTQLKRSEEGPQLLLKSESSDKDGREDYKPIQFTNSLGKLQAVTVKAPRKIIDLGVVNTELIEVSSSQKDSRNYKKTLMELERLYTSIIEAEDCDKKLAALPTGTAMRSQVSEERTRALAVVAQVLSQESRLKRFLLVRKGKTLLKRCVPLLDDSCIQMIFATLFQLFPFAVKRDREDQLLLRFWPDIKSHLTNDACSYELLTHYLTLLNAGAAAAATAGSGKMGVSTFKLALSHPLGVSVILCILQLFAAMQPALSAADKKNIANLTSEVTAALSEVSEVANPLEVIEVDWKALKIAEDKQIQRLAEASRIVKSS